MNYLESLLKLKPSKLFTVLFYTLGLFHPVLVNLDLIMNGESRNGLVVGYEFIDKQSENEFIQGNEASNVKYSLIEVVIDSTVYEYDSGMYSRYDLDERIKVIVDKDNPSDYLILSFTYLYFSLSGLSLFLGFLFYTLFLYVQDFPKTRKAYNRG
jgi:hypothetical protein